MANAMITNILALQRKEAKGGKQQEGPSANEENEDEDEDEEEERNSEVRFPPIPVGTRVEVQSNERQQGTVMETKDDGTFRTSVRIDGGGSKTYLFDRSHLRILGRESDHMEAPKEEQGLRDPARAFAFAVASNLSVGASALVVLIAACVLTLTAPMLGYCGWGSGGLVRSALAAGFLRRKTQAAVDKEERAALPPREKAAPGDAELMPPR